MEEVFVINIIINIALQYSNGEDIYENPFSKELSLLKNESYFKTDKSFLSNIK
jgi:hypothetical protein